MNIKLVFKSDGHGESYDIHSFDCEDGILAIHDETGTVDEFDLDDLVSFTVTTVTM